MRMFWFDYEGRYITYEEALIEFEHDAEAYPKFKPREGGIFGVKKY